MGTRKREMDRDKDRYRDRVTGLDVQGQRDMNRWIGQRQEEGQSDRARCTGTERWGQGTRRWIWTKTGTGTE